MIASLTFGKRSEAVLFGETAYGPNWEAVISLSGCTATFVHPRFAITAAHCIRQCISPSDVGCVTAPPEEVLRGNWQGREGSVRLFGTTGVRAGEGKKYGFDFVYFPTPQEMGRSSRPDVALLRSRTRFRGRVIPVLPLQDLPRPDENNYCPRYEYTWPTVVGFSPNSGLSTPERRFGSAFAECDLEQDETLFKLDAHGRNVRGVRICQGDSGGPVLWETGFGGFAVGGIISVGDTRNPNDPFIDNQMCMNWGNPDDQLRGESGHAFIPVDFLNRVARADAVCGDASGWETCANGFIHYGGYRLRYLDVRIEQCGKENLSISGVDGKVNIRRGGTGAVEVSGYKFRWDCGNKSDDSTKGPGNTRFVIARRGITDRQVIFDAYQILAHPSETGESTYPLTNMEVVPPRFLGLIM